MKKTFLLSLFLLLNISVFAQFPGGGGFGGGYGGGFGGGGFRGGMPQRTPNETPADDEDSGKSEYFITGKVLDENGEPMVGVSVRLMSAADSSVVTGVGTMTDDGGNFKLNNLQRGSYLTYISFIGYKPLYKEVKLLRVQPSAELGSLSMEVDAIMLEEAVVTGIVPPVVVKEDTLEYNADSFKTQPNAVVEDMLKKLPGVEIDDNGTITVQGKEVKKILVDGKEFFSDDPKVASKNLPANMVNKIQVVDRKSDEARFSGIDDGDEETVINLTVKKGMKQGWFGTAQAGGGTQMAKFDPMYEVNASANRFINSSQFSLLGSYNNTNNQGASDLGQSMFSGSNRMGGGGNNRGTGTSGLLGGNFNTGNESETFRIGGDVSYMGSDRFSKRRSETQNFLTEDSSSFVNSNSENINISHNLRMNFRLRWQIDTLTTLEFTPQFGFNKSHLENNSYSETMGGRRNAMLADRDSVNDRRSNSASDAQGYNLSGRLSFSRAFKSNPLRKFSFSFNYRTNRQEEDGSTYDVLNFYRLGKRDSIRNQLDDNLEKGASYDVRATYVEPLSKHYYLNFVYQYRYNTNDGEAYYYNVDDDGNYLDIDVYGRPEADSTYSNVSHSRYQTHRGEISLRGVYTKMNFNVGVNVEHQKRETMYEFGRNKGNDITTRNLNFSPTLQMRYRISKQKNLRLNYRGNTTQPSARQLQATPNITNPLNIYIGNPDLKSSFQHRLSLQYQTQNPNTQQSFRMGVDANTTQNAIIDKTTYTAAGGQERTPININGNWAASTWVFYNMPFQRNKRFSFNTNTNAGYQNSIGFVSLDRKSDSQRNVSRNVNFNERASIRYNSEHFNVSLGANYGLSYVNNTIQTANNLLNSNYGANANIDWFLDCGLSFGTDCRYTGRSGMAEGYNQHKVNWNASIAYSMLEKKNLTVRFKVYDILQQNTNISRSVTGTSVSDQETNALGSYCMLYLAYQFNTLGKGGNAREGGRGGGDRPRGYERF